ncbi:hypothetical protein M569_15687 [Genlisea aurea]|uniref:TF-B3 domain-containing protein n=1 Tax=Genlisea aurea TaxID=192259 RepID=S8D8U1_9LAMI|nr:hypothetical protein M569_15687 [Genlisea aurea]
MCIRSIRSVSEDDSNWEKGTGGETSPKRNMNERIITEKVKNMFRYSSIVYLCNVQDPGPRNIYFRPEDKVISVIVRKPEEETEPNPEIILRYAEAAVLTNDRDILIRPRKRRFIQITAFDSCGTKFELDLWNFVTRDGEITYVVGGKGWNRFVGVHRIKPGDELTFYRLRDCNSNDGDIRFALRFFRQPRTPANLPPKSHS